MFLLPRALISGLNLPDLNGMIFGFLAIPLDCVELYGKCDRSAGSTLIGS